MIQNLSTFPWLFKVLCFVLRLKCSYQEQTALYYYSTSVRTHFLTSTSTQVTCNIRSPPKLWYASRIRCDRSHGAMKGVDLAPRHKAKGDSWLKKPKHTQINEKSTTGTYRRSFTSHTGSVPQSTLQYVLLPFRLPIQTKGENAEGSRGRAKTHVAAHFFVTWNHGLILSRRTGLYPLLSNIICLTKGSASKHLSETRAPSLQDHSASGKDMTRLLLDKYQLPFSLFLIFEILGKKKPKTTYLFEDKICL